MTAPISGPTLGTQAGTGHDGDRAKLRNAARQLEGVFTQQLFKAMRDTVPEDQGVTGSSSAQDMFTGLLDEHLASDPRATSTHGIGEAIYRHLLRTRGAESDATAPTAAPSTVTPPATGASLRKHP